MLQEVLTHHKPLEWREATYTNQVYQKFQLTPHDGDYDRVTRDFDDLTVKEVWRVQNPFAYGRFVLRKEHMERTDGYIEQSKKYHPISASDIDIACSYNCDPRRYSRTGLYDKTPTFYSSPSMAANRLSGGDKAIVVVQYLGSSSSASWDTQYYPEYVVLID